MTIRGALSLIDRSGRRGSAGRIAGRVLFSTIRSEEKAREPLALTFTSLKITGRGPPCGIFRARESRERDAHSRLTFAHLRRVCVITIELSR